MNDTNVLLPHIKLRLNIDHPSYEECYAYGYECALAELDEESNPYREGSDECEHWLEGWWAGFYGEEPLYRLTEIQEAPPAVDTAVAANEQVYHPVMDSLFDKVVNFTGALTATLIVGYQIVDLVA